MRERSRKLGKEFKFFVHSGSCDGENIKLYHLRIDKDEVPEDMLPYYRKYEETREEFVLNVAGNFTISTTRI